MEEDGEDEGGAEEEGVVEGAEEVEGACGDAGVFEDADCDEDLGAVGDDALDGTGGGVKDAGNATGIAVVFIGEVFGNGAAHNDGDGIIGSEEVDTANEGHDAELAFAVGID